MDGASGRRQLAGLTRKGAIALGHDADLVGVRAGRGVRGGRRRGCTTGNPVTPYAGRPLAGVVRATWLRGPELDVEGEPRGGCCREGDMTERVPDHADRS